MTDKEITKALECCCKNNNCEGCPLDYLTFSSQCASELAIKSLDLINRQKSELEKLKQSPHCRQTNENINISQIKAEAIKEFAERLKDTKFKHGNDYMIYAENIDNIAKEKVGDNNG